MPDRISRTSSARRTALEVHVVDRERGRAAGTTTASRPGSDDVAAEGSGFLLLEDRRLQGPREERFTIGIVDDRQGAKRFSAAFPSCLAGSASHRATAWCSRSEARRNASASRAGRPVPAVRNLLQEAPEIPDERRRLPTDDVELMMMEASTSGAGAERLSLGGSDDRAAAARQSQRFPELDAIALAPEVVVGRAGVSNVR
jgi:hypothetical protein